MKRYSNNYSFLSRFLESKRFRGAASSRQRGWWPVQRTVSHSPRKVSYLLLRDTPGQKEFFTLYFRAFNLNKTWKKSVKMYWVAENWGLKSSNREAAFNDVRVGGGLRVVVVFQLKRKLDSLVFNLLWGFTDECSSWCTFSSSFSKESGLPSFSYIFASFRQNDNVWVFLEAPHRESKTNIVSCGLEVNKTVGDVGHGSAHERAHTTMEN